MTAREIQTIWGRKDNVLLDIRANLCIRMSLSKALQATKNWICKSPEELETLLTNEITKYPVEE